MNVHHLRAVDDEQLIIRRGGALGDDAISHAASMFQTTPVQKLMHSAESAVVLVNGCSDRNQNTRISPVTHVCATLTHALRRYEPNVVLVFFCGQHSNSTDDLVGPQGLMRSLVASLVLSLIQKECISFSAPIRFSGDFQGNFEQLSFEDICLLFCQLVELVPKKFTVYCVVDGISYYERDTWRGDYDLMMQSFGSVIANKVMAPVFKLLLTSPTKSRWLPDLLAPQQRVSLRNTRNRGASSPESYVQAAQAALGNPVSEEDRQPFRMEF
jgi:hypothetical protein